MECKGKKGVAEELNRTCGLQSSASPVSGVQIIYSDFGPVLPADFSCTRAKLSQKASLQNMLEETGCSSRANKCI